MPIVQPDEYCLFWINWWATCLTKSEWASWTQALGTILGIAAAAWGLIWQVRRNAKQAFTQLRATEVQKLQVLGGVVASMFFHLNIYRWDSERGHVSEHDRFSLERGLEQLERTNLSELPDWEAWHGVELAVRAASIFLTRMNEVEEKRPALNEEIRHRHRVPYINEAEIGFESAMECLTGALTRRGGEHSTIGYEVDGRNMELTKDGLLRKS